MYERAPLYAGLIVHKHTYAYISVVLARVKIGG